MRRPRKRDLLLEADASRISLLEFMRLYDCKLGEVIGERNSVLGKVAPPSQRLFNTLDFLLHAPACIATLRDKQDHALAGKLTAAMAAKREDLAIVISNATLASEEFSDLWHVPGTVGSFPDDPTTLPTAELRYIESEVARWLSGDPTHDRWRFEEALGTLRHGEAGLLIAAATLTRSRLEAANRMLRGHEARRPSCTSSEGSAWRRGTRRLFGASFMQEIRPWIDRVTTLGEAFLAPHRALEAHLDAAQSPAYRHWREQRDTQLAWLSSAPRRHVGHMQAVLAACDPTPSAANG